MTTRAVQIEMLLAGIRDASTGAIVNAGTAYFYEAGTTTAKNVWTEKEKTNPYTSYTLSTIGTAFLYGDGIYKINVLDSDGAQVSGFPRDNVKVRHPNYYTRQATATTSQTSDDDFIEVDTTSNAVTINLITASSWVQPLKVMHVSGGNAVTLNPYGSELIDGAATYSFTSPGTIVEIVPTAALTGLRKAGIRSSMQDADGDTKIQVEESPDEDKIRMDTGGTERVIIDGTNGLDLIKSPSGTVLSINGVSMMVVGSTPPVGGPTAGHRIRCSELYVLDGTNAASLKLFLGSIWGGHNTPTVDNIVDATSDTYFDYVAASDRISIKGSGISATLVACIASIITENLSAVDLIATATISSNELLVDFSCPDGTPIVLTTLVDTGWIHVRLIYITSV